MDFVLNGVKVKNLFCNGVKVKKLYLNGVKVFGAEKIALTNSNYKMKTLYPDAYKTMTDFPTEDYVTSGLTSMLEMFSYCEAATSLDLTGFDTSKVTSMYSAFQFCRALTEIDLSYLDTSNLLYMGSMFWMCSSLKHINLTGFKTDKVTNMSTLFSGCSALTSLDLSSFDTSHVKGFSFMFSGCKNLAEIKGVIDLKSVDLRVASNGATYWNKMFEDCTKLTGVKIKNPPAGFDGAGLKPNQYTIVK